MKWLSWLVNRASPLGPRRVRCSACGKTAYPYERHSCCQCDTHGRVITEARLHDFACPHYRP